MQDQQVRRPPAKLRAGQQAVLTAELLSVQGAELLLVQVKAHVTDLEAKLEIEQVAQLWPAPRTEA